VTIPADFSPVRDERLAYSLAVPKGWTELDLRSQQVQTIASFFGMGEQLTPLNEFLDSPEGQMIGRIYVTDLTSAMFGGLPSVLNVSVLDAPALSAEGAAGMVRDVIEQNIGAVGSDIVVNDVHATVINNLPAVEGSATAALTGLGRDDQIYGRVVALLANDKAYILTLLLPADQQAAKADVIAQIIGTFRPE
jgi:hypothetical protein